MDSNIEFKSNVYPLKGNINNDKVYLSKIYDYVRIKKINERLSETEKITLWNETQKKILREKPVCEYSDSDPCWGMVKENGKCLWVCKCIKTDCPHFDDCREDFDEYEDEEEIRLFSPLYNECKGYEYEFETSDIYLTDIYEPKPEIIYESSEDKNEDDEEDNKSKVINSDDYIDVVSLIKKEKQKEIEQEKQKELEENKISEENEELDDFEEVFEDTENIVENDLQQSNSKEQDIPDNIFESFEECTQEDIISASSKDLIFVDAGPGTGKTYTLLQRILYLVNEENVEPEEIVVLCFTNAAVDEIKDRLKNIIKNGGNRKLNNVQIRTFHSFAWWLISAVNENFEGKDWKYVDKNILNFTSSIIVAKKAVEELENEIFDDWSHFIVDEIQDLTNELGHFVLSMIKSCIENDCGVTVFGDYCQAIYDYTNKEKEYPFGSEDFYNELFKSLWGKAKYFKLLKNMRQTESLISVHENLRKAILSKNLCVMQEATSKIIEKVEYLDKKYDQLTEEDFNKLRGKGKVCMLFRNNGETMRISSDLRKMGIPHQLNVAETTFNYAPWISEVFGQFEKEQISEEEFKSIYDDLENEYKFSADEIWYEIQNLMGYDDSIYKVEDILENIFDSKKDSPLFRVNNNENIVISTIHRAKGREYDCVIMDKSFMNGLTKDKDTNTIEEYRTLYVGVTRPKKRLVSLKGPKKESVYPIYIYRTRNKRWGRPKNKQLVYLEFNGKDDIDDEQFAYIDQDMFSEINIGDSLTLKRKIKNNVASYELYHDDTDYYLGTIKSTYSDDIKYYMKIENAIDMPSEISNLYVTGIYSKIVDNEFLKNNPKIAEVAPNGVWKWLEIMGIGHLSYDTY